MNNKYVRNEDGTYDVYGNFNTVSVRNVNSPREFELENDIEITEDAIRNIKADIDWIKRNLRGDFITDLSTMLIVSSTYINLNLSTSNDPDMKDHSGFWFILLTTVFASTNVAGLTHLIIKNVYYRRAIKELKKSIIRAETLKTVFQSEIDRLQTIDSSKLECGKCISLESQVSEDEEKIKEIIMYPSDGLTTNERIQVLAKRKKRS